MPETICRVPRGQARKGKEPPTRGKQTLRLDDKLKSQKDESNLGNKSYIKKTYRTLQLFEICVDRGGDRW